MSGVLIWFGIIVGCAGLRLVWSLARAAGWADERMEEIKILEDFQKKERNENVEQIKEEQQNE